MKRALMALLLSAFVAFPAIAREGFGMMKKSVSLTRTIPPSTNAGARRVKVNVTSDRSDARDDAQTLNRYISEAILSGSGTLADSGRPEVTVDVSLDRVESHESYDTETEYVRQQTGTKRKWNESKKKYEDEPIYSNVPVQKTYKVLTASVTGSYDISTRSSDVASGSIDQEFREKYGDGDTSRAPSDVEDELMRKASREIVAYLVPTTERVNVLLPRSTFEQFIPLAEEGEWERYLAAVEGVAPNRNAKDEAYRQYALGVAKEALAYENANENKKDALQMLQAAHAHYQAAVNSNSSEELFRKGYVSLLSSSGIGPPVARVSESVTRFEKWNAAPVRVATREPDPEPEPEPKARTKKTSTTAKRGMRNETVIDLAKAGLSDENIKLAIDGAEATAFDVSPEGLIALAKGGVSKPVIAHMQKKMPKR